eukprot:scaffold124002_cov31-Tisochrysis_lutea.AAC.1
MPQRQRRPSPVMRVCAAGAWLVGCMWLGIGMLDLDASQQVVNKQQDTRHKTQEQDALQSTIYDNLHLQLQSTIQNLQYNLQSTIYNFLH